MKPPLIGILLLSLAAGLGRVAGPPLTMPDLCWRLDRVAGAFTPAAPAGGLFAALTTLETVLEKQ